MSNFEILGPNNKSVLPRIIITIIGTCWSRLLTTNYHHPHQYRWYSGSPDSEGWTKELDSEIDSVRRLQVVLGKRSDVSGQSLEIDSESRFSFFRVVFVFSLVLALVPLLFSLVLALVLALVYKFFSFPNILGVMEV